jgi:hypothetical protein
MCDGGREGVFHVKRGYGKGGWDVGMFHVERVHLAGTWGVPCGTRKACCGDCTFGFERERSTGTAAGFSEDVGGGHEPYVSHGRWVREAPGLHGTFHLERERAQRAREDVPRERGKLMRARGHVYVGRGCASWAV